MADYYKIRKHTSKLLLEHILHTSHHKSICAFASPVLNMVIHLGIHVVLVGLTLYEIKSSAKRQTVELILLGKSLM